MVLFNSSLTDNMQTTNNSLVEYKDGNSSLYSKAATSLNPIYENYSATNPESKKIMLTALKEGLTLTRAINQNHSAITGTGGNDAKKSSVNHTIERVHLNSNEGVLSQVLAVDNGNLSPSMLSTINKYKSGFNGTYVLEGNTEKILEHYAYNTVQYFMPDGKGAETMHDADSQGKVMYHAYTETKVVPSIFNPYKGIKTRGIIYNIPLLDVPVNGSDSGDREADLSDCSIMRLLQLSALEKNYTGEAEEFSAKHLGFQFYKLADFMYCKDLGKVPNNHLITLRRFSAPVEDNIYGISRSRNKENLHAMSPEIGHMVTWFGTENNKLSDILKFNYKATWREMNASIEEVQSKEDNPDTGILGMIANSLNPAYNAMQGAGGTGTHNIISWLLGSFGSIGPINFGRPGQNSQQGMNSDTLGNYDKNKIYEPKNTIQRNHYYEGKIEFEHEFTLNFSYKLNAYGTINSKSAMLDLIGNIMQVTFVRGSFWGGARKFIGPPQNTSAWKKMNAFIDDKWDQIGGFTEDALRGNLNWADVLGSLTNSAMELLQKALDWGKSVAEDPKSWASQVGNAIADFCKEHKIGDAIKGQLKNALGRPARYAMSSLISGEATGLWHLTVGNPRNPIACIGNLIMTNAEFSFGDAPLGLDDFPSEINVAITLKHGKPRDKVDIERMFTRGEGSIYIGLDQQRIRSYYTDITKIEDTKHLTWENYQEKSFTQKFGTNKIEMVATVWHQA